VLGTGLRVNWTAATGADGYKVERAPDVAGAPGTWAQAASGVTVLHFDDGGLTANTSYWYRVRGTNGAGDGANSPARNVTTAAAGPPLGIWDQTNWDQSLWQ
jgi:phosphodiesterase/alkaline phosphatase D-like protein